MSIQTFNCLACHIMANSEKLKLSKWRSNSKEPPKRNIEAIQSISLITKKEKLTNIAAIEKNQEII